LFSPNHIEALSLLGVEPSPNPSTLGMQILKAAFDLSRNLLPGSAVIIRAGVMGACVCVQDEHGKMTSRFIPAYHGKEEQEKVVDDTGECHNSIARIPLHFGRK
jgi:hypothetical protein